MAAVRNGVGIDTTMGLTPAGGLMMGTRSGDLDPGILVYLLQEKGRSPSTINYLVNQRSGLIGVSGSSSDMRDLLSREAADPHAAQAVEMFCYHARKFVAAMASARRARYVRLHRRRRHKRPRSPPANLRGLEFMDIRLDAARNEANAAVISADDTP